MVMKQVSFPVVSWRRPLMICVPDMVRSAIGAVPVHVVVAGWLGGESPLSTRQGERLAERQGCSSWDGIWRKPKAKHWPDVQKSHSRRSQWVRRQISSKPNTCTESVIVYAAALYTTKIRSKPAGFTILSFLAQKTHDYGTHRLTHHAG